jgi:hypothetical protein
MKVSGDIHAMDEGSTTFNCQETVPSTTRRHMNTPKPSPARPIKTTPLSAGLVRGLSNGFGSIFKKSSPNDGTATTAVSTKVDESGISYGDDGDDVEEVEEVEEVYNAFS